jgi:hypothetical protein
MWPNKTSNEPAKLILAKLINEENNRYAMELEQLKTYPGIQALLDTLSFAHKRVLTILEAAYGEL